MNYIGIDLGTSSVKLVLMDTAGHIIANVSKSYPIDYPKAGWSEQNPYDWYDACMEGMKELLDRMNQQLVVSALVDRCMDLLFLIRMMRL